MNALGITLLVLLGLVLAFILYRLTVDIIWNNRLKTFHKTNENPTFRSPLRMVTLKRGMVAVSTVMIAVVLVVTDVFSLPGSVFDVETGNYKTLLTAKKASSEQDLIKKLDYGNGIQFPSFSFDFGTDDVFEEPGISLPPGLIPDTEEAAPKSIVGTNNQVEGVEESDIVKTDGELILYTPTYKQNKIYVFDVNETGILTELDPIEFFDLKIESLYLTDEKIVVIGYRIDQLSYFYDARYGTVMIEPWYYSSSYGVVVVINRETFEVEYDFELNGRITESRVVDNIVYIVETTYTTERALVPTFNVSTYGEERKLTKLPYEKIFFFDDVPGFNMTTIITINLETLTFDAQAILGVTGYLYMNKNSIYFVGNYSIYPFLGFEKSGTHLVKFKVNTETGRVSYAASMILEGSVSNQFFLDEYNGMIRVATSREWNVTDVNRLYVLKESLTTDEFEVVGLLDEGIGKPGERITSVKFFENFAYIVTFRNTDPLYTIDLTDPAKPEIINEIEEPGYSTYLHRFGEHHLVGIGYDANFGVKVSVYDAENRNTPIKTYYFNQESQEGVSYTYARALSDHKAILVSEELGFIGFAVNKIVYDDYGYYYQSSFFIFNIDFDTEDVISEPLIISHRETGYENEIDKGIYIDGIFYTFSSAMVVSYNSSTQSIYQEVELR